MALGGLTLTIKVNAVDKVLKRINQDNYKTEYWLHEATGDFRAFVRHSKVKSQGVTFDHHNVEIVQTVFATATTPSRTRISYLTVRNQPDDDFTLAGHVTTALLDLGKVAGNVDDLLTWVS